MHPLLNKTIRRTDDGKVATIIAAVRLDTGSDNETFPGINCTLLFDQGLPTEQLGHLVFSGQGTGNSHATLKVSDSPNGAWQAKSQDGLVSAPGSAGQDFDFTPATELSSHSQTFGLKAPYTFKQKQGAVAGYVLTAQDSHGNSAWAPAGGGGGSGFGLTPTAIKTANYSANAGEMVLADTFGGPFTVTLPSAPPDGTMVGALVIYSNDFPFPYVMVARGGSDTFTVGDGSASAGPPADLTAYHRGPRGIRRSGHLAVRDERRPVGSPGSRARLRHHRRVVLVNS